MIDYADGHPRTGVIGVLTDTGVIQKAERFSAVVGFKGGDIFDYFNHLPPMIREISASCVPFSCVLLRRDMIARVGLLDEDFSPGLGDDDDYCDRARLAGWRTVLLLNVLVRHAHRTTIGKLPNYEAIYKRNHELLQRKMAERRAR